MNATAIYSIPLAPPAPQPPALRVEKNTAPVTVTWKEWLSPKLGRSRQQQQLQRQRPQNRNGYYDDDDDHDGASPRATRRQQQRRNRSASFDLTPTATNTTSFSNADGDKDSELFRISKSAYAFSATNRNAHRGNGATGGARNDSLHSSHSLLTTFLLRLYTILPEFCAHLSLTSEDTLLSIGEASKAVDVLEKKNKADHRLSHETTTKRGRGAAKSPLPSSVLRESPASSTSAPSSPAHSPTKTLTNDFRSWLSPQQQIVSTVGLASKWDAKESQWESFASPFLNLIAAECLYARMEHVLDPSRCFSSTGAGGRKDSSSNDLKGVDKSEKRIVIRRAKGSLSAIPPPISPADSSKRGSRRLITIYRQIREELVIVGEYLVDPVIGARGAGGGTTSLPVVSSECNTALEQRDFAAASVRTTLNALISFIDARVVLIRLHGELCFFQVPPSLHLLKDEGGHGLCGQSCKKWIALAQQCQTSNEQVSALVVNEENVCVTQRAVSNIMKELKCLELVLTSIGNLLACDRFNCVVNIRRLHVLLETISYRRTCLPLLYIAASLPELLAIMHIYFPETACQEMMRRNVTPISPRPYLIKTPLQSTLSERPSSNRKITLGGKSNKSTDFDSLFADFIVGANADIDLPLAVALVRRIRRMQASSAEEGQTSEDADESKHPDSTWKPLYMKCREANHAGRNTSPDGDTGVKTGESNADEANSANRQGIEWGPFNYWDSIEKVLTKHCSAPATIDPVKHTIIGNYVQPVYVHVMAITDSICLIVIQGVGGEAKWQGASDNEIQDFLRIMVSKLSPEHLLSMRAVMHLKSEVFSKIVEDKEHPHHGNNKVQIASLWGESDWSNDQGKKVLHSLGLRRMSSPVIQPLKSPYLKRKIRQLGGRQRPKQKKSSLNHGHLAFFLGPELINFPIPSEFDFVLLNRI